MNDKPTQKLQTSKSKCYDLEERTYIFAKRVNEYINKLTKPIPNIENGKQLVKSSGSVGANYIEANESLSKKDFQMRIKICKKEAKESRYWLKLTEPKLLQGMAARIVKAKRWSVTLVGSRE